MPVPATASDTYRTVSSYLVQPLSINMKMTFQNKKTGNLKTDLKENMSLTS